MRAFASLVLSFALLAVCLPLIEAQAPKVVIGLDPKDPKKLTIGLAQKDPAEKAQDEKKDDPTTEPKVVPKKIVRVDETVVLNSPRFLAKVKDLKAEQKEVVAVFVDNKKVFEMTDWDNKQLAASRTNPKGFNIAKYRADKQKMMDDCFSGEVRTFTVTDAARIRSAFLPPQFDADGKEKKLSGAELAKLKSARLPGFNSEFGQLREGQIIEVYVVKQAAPKKSNDPPAKTPKFIGADPTLNVPAESGKLEIHMLVIKSQN